MPYVDRNEAGVIVGLYATIQNPMFHEARTYLSTDRLAERLEEYPNVAAEATRLGLSFDAAVTDICARWPEWLDDAELGAGGAANAHPADAPPTATPVENAAPEADASVDLGGGDGGGDMGADDDGVADDTIEAAHGLDSPGIMLGEHTLDERKNTLTLALLDACEDRIEARALPGYAERLAQLRGQQQGAKEKSLPDLTDEDVAELAFLESLDSWINRMRAYCALTQRALRAWSQDDLDAFDIALAEWPA